MKPAAFAVMLAGARRQWHCTVYRNGYCLVCIRETSAALAVREAVRCARISRKSRIPAVR